MHAFSDEGIIRTFNFTGGFLKGGEGIGSQITTQHKTAAEMFAQFSKLLPVCTKPEVFVSTTT